MHCPQLRLVPQWARVDTWIDAARWNGGGSCAGAEMEGAVAVALPASYGESEGKAVARRGLG